MILLAAVALAAMDPNATALFKIPEQYQGDNTVTAVFTDQKTIDSHCGKAPEGYHDVGCAVGKILYLPNPCRDKDAKRDRSYSKFLCHELAHVNGWHHINE